MRKYLTGILLLWLSLSVFAEKMDKVIVFGDSLSDNGNIASLTRKLHNTIPIVPVIPKPNVYYQGHFTNGSVWAEVFSEQLGFDINDVHFFEDHAYGGAWAESVLKSKLIFPPSLSAQVSSYLLENYFDKNKGDHLYTLWIGGNDYLSQQSEHMELADKTIAAIRYQLDRLFYYGARYVIVPNLPDLGKTPKAVALHKEAELSAISDYHNKLLKEMVAELRETYPEFTLIEIDVNETLQEIYRDGKNNHYHFKHFADPCYTGAYYLKAPAEQQAMMSIAAQAGLHMQGNASLMATLGSDEDYTICENPNEYLFWDLVHPTAKVHQLIGAKAVDKLKALGLF